MDHPKKLKVTNDVVNLPQAENRLDGIFILRRSSDESQDSRHSNKRSSFFSASGQTDRRTSKRASYVKAANDILPNSNRVSVKLETNRDEHINMDIMLDMIFESIYTDLTSFSDSTDSSTPDCPEITFIYDKTWYECSSDLSLEEENIGIKSNVLFVELREITRSSEIANPSQMFLKDETEVRSNALNVLSKFKEKISELDVVDLTDETHSDRNLDNSTLDFDYDNYEDSFENDKSNHDIQIQPKRSDFQKLFTRSNDSFRQKDKSDFEKFVMEIKRSKIFEIDDFLIEPDVVLCSEKIEINPENVMINSCFTNFIPIKESEIEITSIDDNTKNENIYIQKIESTGTYSILTNSFDKTEVIKIPKSTSKIEIKESDGSSSRLLSKLNIDSVNMAQDEALTLNDNKVVSVNNETLIEPIKPQLFIKSSKESTSEKTLSKKSRKKFEEAVAKQLNDKSSISNCKNISTAGFKSMKQDLRNSPTSNYDRINNKTISAVMSENVLKNDCSIYAEVTNKEGMIHSEDRDVHNDLSNSVISNANVSISFDSFHSEKTDKEDIELNNESIQVESNKKSESSIESDNPKTKKCQDYNSTILTEQKSIQVKENSSKWYSDDELSFSEKIAQLIATEIIEIALVENINVYLECKLDPIDISKLIPKEKQSFQNISTKLSKNYAKKSWFSDYVKVTDIKNDSLKSVKSINKVTTNAVPIHDIPTISSVKPKVNEVAISTDDLRKDNVNIEVYEYTTNIVSVNQYVIKPPIKKTKKKKPEKSSQSFPKKIIKKSNITKSKPKSIPTNVLSGLDFKIDCPLPPKSSLTEDIPLQRLLRNDDIYLLKNNYYLNINDIIESLSQTVILKYLGFTNKPDRYLLRNAIELTNTKSKRLKAYINRNYPNTKYRIYEMLYNKQLLDHQITLTNINRINFHYNKHITYNTKQKPLKKFDNHEFEPKLKKVKSKKPPLIYKTNKPKSSNHYS